MKVYNFKKYFESLKQRITLEELAVLIGKEFSVNNVDLFSYGSNGIVYTFGEDRLLKITTSLNEALTAQKINGIKFKHVSTIFNVRKFIESKKYILDNGVKAKIRLPYFHSIYMIIVEKVYDTEKAEIIINDIYDVLNTTERKVAAADIKKFKSLFNYFKSQLDIIETKTNKDDLINYYKQLIELSDELSEYKINTSDVHAKNFGFRKNGDLVLFDLESKKITGNIKGIMDIDDINI